MADTKTISELLGPEPKTSGAVPTVGALLSKPYQAVPGGMGYGYDSVPQSSKEMDQYLAHSPTGRVLDAFGQGFKDAWGAQTLPGLSDQSIAELRQIGMFNDYQNGEHSIIKAANEAFVRPAAAALDLFIRGSGAAYYAAQSAVAQVGTETGQPQLGRDLASVPDAFFGSPHPFGVPHPPAPVAPLVVPDLAKARELGVIGLGEQGWKYGPQTVTGRLEEPMRATAEVPAPAPAEAVPTAAETAATQSPAQAAYAADVHKTARAIAPETFQQYDTLAQRKETFRRWLGELSDKQAEDAWNSAPHAQEIADLQERMQTATPRLQKKYQSRLDKLTTERNDYLDTQTAGDTPDMAKVRQRLMATDYEMRDLAPDVAKAYQEARQRVPEPDGVALEPQSAPPQPAVPEAQPPGTVPAPSKNSQVAPIQPEATTQPAAPVTPPQDVLKPTEVRSAPVEPPTPSPTEPQPVPPEAAPAPAAPVPPQPVSTPQQVQAITAAVSQKLTAAGRPQVEADAAAQLIAAHYEARAQRFEGRKGSALDLYKAEAPEIKAGRSRRVRELAQKNELFQRGEAPPFYSAVERTIENAKQEKASPDQWRGILKNAAGVKPDEIKWLGLDDWLKEQKGAVTKQDIADYVRANSIKIQEIEKGTSPSITKTESDILLRALLDKAKVGDISGFYADQLWRRAKEGSAEAIGEIEGLGVSDSVIAPFRGQRAGGPTKFGQYTLPGGQNYRELLLTLPKKENYGVKQAEGKYRLYDFKTNDWVRTPDGKVRTGFDTEAAAQQTADGLNQTSGANPMGNFVSGHFEEPNILAHVRFNDRTINGKKTLFIEEVQSDWHQKGKRQGYQTPEIIAAAKAARQRADALRPSVAEMLKRNDDLGFESTGMAQRAITAEDPAQWQFNTPEDLALAREYHAARVAERANPPENINRAPDAPFKTTWPELVMKRMIRYAAENGYDEIAWTPGDVQAARYDLSKQVGRITYSGDSYLKAFDKNNNEVISRSGVKPSDLPDIIGKEAAEKLLAKKPDVLPELKTLAAKDLKITQDEHQYMAETPDGRKTSVGRGTVGSEAEARDYMARYLNKLADEINSNRRENYGALGPVRTLEGQDLKVGGEGMRGFYDQILPSVVNKLAKKFGAKVGTGNLPDRPLRSDAIYRELTGSEPPKAAKGETVHVLPITEDLRDAATQEGFPLFQSKGSRTGKIHIAQDARNTITLFEHADASTFLHETGHQWLEELMTDAADAQAPAGLKTDAATVRKWLGASEDGRITTGQHEKFARGFEAYVMEGRAPSRALANVFSQFRQWLLDIYRSVAGLRVNITNDIRDVYDRLLSANPERQAIIAGETPPAKSFADLHEADVASTPPAQARTAAAGIQAERDAVAADQASPEVQNARLENVTSGAGRRAPGSAQSGGAGNEAGPAAGPGGAGEGTGTLGARGSEAPVQGVGTPEAAGTAAGVKPAPEPTEPSTPYPQPASALVDKAGNIRLDNLNTPEDINTVLRDFAEQNGGFMDERGVVPDAQVLALSDAMGTDVTLADMRRFADEFGKGGLSAKVIKLREMLVQSANGVREAMAKAASGSDADVAAYAQAKARHQMIQGTLSAVTAEAGRALRSFRDLAGLRSTRELNQFLQENTGRTLFQLRQEAQLGMQLETPEQISKYMHDLAKPTLWDMAIEVWINALLSGPMTHATNMLSNALVAMYRIPETAVASMIGKVRHGLGAEGERVLAGEVGDELFGLIQGAQEGIRAGWESVKSEAPIEESLKVEQRRYQAVPSATVNIAGHEMQIGGAQVRLPGRLLQAEDQIFKSIAYRQTLNALARRQAWGEGLRGDALAQRIAELVNSPTDKMMEAAKAAADYQTFTTKLGKLGSSVQAFANSHPLIKLVVPFVRTPVNIVKFAGERSLFGLFMKEVRANLRGDNGPAMRDTQMARLAVGTAVSTMAAYYAVNGDLTGGGPSDPRMRALLYAEGWQPYSVKIGDHYYSYQRMEPLGTLLGVAADMAEVAHAMTAEQADEVGKLIFASVSKNLTSKTWLSGPSQLIQAINDPDRYGKRYIQSLAGTVVPTGIAQFNRTQDPYLRDARTILDGIKARVPGYSETLQPRVDIWGQPVKLGGSLGPDLISPIYESRIKNDPVNKALIRLGIAPAKVPRKIRGIELTDDQYHQYATLAGQLAKHRLDLIVNQPWFATLPDFVQKEMITKTISGHNGAREMARNIIMMQHPEIINQAVQNKLKPLQKQPAQ